MTKLRGATQVAACLSLLLGACSSSGTGSVDGDISYDHRANSDAPSEEKLLLHPDGTAHRYRDGYFNLDEDATLSPALTDALYLQASDAHVESLAADISCDSFNDREQSYTVMVEEYGQPHQTVTHCLSGPPSSLVKLLDTIGCVLSNTSDNGMTDQCLPQA